MIKLQFKLPQALISRGFTRRTVFHAPAFQQVRLEQKTSSFIRKWLNLHHSTTNICFYSSSSPCPLPIKSLTSIFKSCKISGLLLLRDSRDPLVSVSKPNLKSGSWNANGRSSSFCRLRN